MNVYGHSMDSLVVARKNGAPRLWGINYATGNIYLLDAYNASTDAGIAFQSKFRTRNYFFRTHSDKKYDECYLYLDTNGSASVDLNFIAVNPDGKWTLDTFTNKTLGTAVRRALANKKCMGGKLEVVVKSGKPSIYSVGVDGSLVGRSIFSSF